METNDALIGVESKRFEPFRDMKTATLSSAYDRDVWGSGMEPFTRMRDALRESGDFQLLDAVQLVKHAFGLVTEARRRGNSPVLLYLFAEPAERAGKPISQEALRAHRDEVRRFSDAVAGADVRFAACKPRPGYNQSLCTLMERRLSRAIIYTVDQQGELTAMRPAEPRSEDFMQHLVAAHPQLISDQDGALLLIRREQPIADRDEGGGRWSLDHLFVTRSGIPVLV